MAAVSIGMLTGENGIITQAQKSKEQSDIGYEKEQVSLAYSSAKTQKISRGDYTEVDADDINEQLNIQKANATARGSSPIIVKFNDSQREYKIQSNGLIEEKPPVNIDMSTIYEYEAENGEAVITGIKEEYLIPYEKETGKINKETQIASLRNIYIASSEGVEYRLLVDKVGTNLEVHEVIDGNTIVGIGEKAFEGIMNLESIIIPKTIIHIDRRAFCCCEILNNVEIVNGLSNIGQEAFGGCYSLYSIIIPSSVVSIKSFAFDDSLKTIIIERTDDSIIYGAPWGANNADIKYINVYKSFLDEYLKDKNQYDFEELILKSEHFLGTFDDYLKDIDMTREELMETASNMGMSYEEYLKYSLTYEKDKNNSWIYIEYLLSTMGYGDKSEEELENILINDIIGENEFNKILEERGVTKEELYDESCKSIGLRTREDFFKFTIIYFQLEGN